MDASHSAHASESVISRTPTTHASEPFVSSTPTNANEPVSRSPTSDLPSRHAFTCTSSTSNADSLEERRKRRASAFYSALSAPGLPAKLFPTGAGLSGLAGPATAAEQTAKRTKLNPTDNLNLHLNLREDARKEAPSALAKPPAGGSLLDLLAASRGDGQAIAPTRPRITIPKVSSERSRGPPTSRDSGGACLALLIDNDTDDTCTTSTNDAIPSIDALISREAGAVHMSYGSGTGYTTPSTVSRTPSTSSTPLAAWGFGEEAAGGDGAHDGFQFRADHAADGFKFRADHAADGFKFRRRPLLSAVREDGATGYGIAGEKSRYSSSSPLDNPRHPTGYLEHVSKYPSFSDLVAAPSVKGGERGRYFDAGSPGGSLHLGGGDGPGHDLLGSEFRDEPGSMSGYYDGAGAGSLALVPSPRCAKVNRSRTARRPGGPNESWIEKILAKIETGEFVWVTDELILQDICRLHGVPPGSKSEWLKVFTIPDLEGSMGEQTKRDTVFRSWTLWGIRSHTRNRVKYFYVFVEHFRREYFSYHRAGSRQ